MLYPSLSIYDIIYNAIIRNALLTPHPRSFKHSNDTHTHHVQVAPDKGHGLVHAAGVLDDEVAPPRRELDPLQLLSE